ncbi:MAG TPA: HD domain-containing protein [Candidatus Saccharimonadales bacterium]|nr:HD domain-containing protein [Candidatus Saccharimonadales bacterium]
MHNLQGLYGEVGSHFAARQHIAHGMDHALRVTHLAQHIAGAEGYDVTEAEVAGLLHDIGRTVQEEEKGHGPAGVPLASELLDRFTGYDDDTKQRILNAVRDHSGLDTEGTLTHIVQDADMLDGLGAVGLMRAYTSKAHLPAYDPQNIVPSVGARDTNIHDQVGFQLEWLGMMHTDTGRELAQRRGAFMLEFLRQFEAEVHGDDFLQRPSTD